MDIPMSKLETMLKVGRTFGVRDGVLRLEYELRRGTGLMSRRMRSVDGWNSWNLQRIAPAASAEQILALRRDGSRQFFFRDVQKLGPHIVGCIGIEGQKIVIAEAERILAGNLPFFGQLSLPCDFPPRWFNNPVTGQSVSPHQPWTHMRFASPVYGDLKFILEPSRFLFVYPLVRAYALTGNERYPRAFWSTIEDWARHSPPMSGPLWICGQECSLRILAWSFALHGFIHSPATTDERAALLISMIAAHAWRIAQTLGYARSQRSNHLISEAVGLWTAGTLYPELRDAYAWQELGAHLLQEAVLDQISPEGVSQQHSFNYQRMILHLLLWTLRFSDIHDAPLHPGILERTDAAFDFIRRWTDPVSGFAPNYGANDGSLILPLTVGSYRDFRPLLQLGAAVLKRPSLPPGPWDEAAIWFGVEPSDKSAAVPPFSADTGYFRLGDENSWALIRAGHYTRRPFQADQLHVDLWWQGINLARDPGTYLYNSATPWNNGLARTAVHNTITVDHRDQMRRAGRFLWLDWAQAKGRVQTSLKQPGANDICIDNFEGEHDGYSRLGVRHRRSVQWLRGAGWVIVDELLGSEEHNVRLHWLVADLPHDVSYEPFQIAFKVQDSSIRWNVFNSSPSRSAVIRAGKHLDLSPPHNSTVRIAASEAQMLGWESPTYGALSPALSLVCETQALLPVRFVTAVLTGERCHLESRGDQLCIFQDDSEIYRVGLAAKSNNAETQPTAASVVRA
jgi:Heparinase II/III-like protein/Heparinase II/III N-terminus